MDICPDPDFDNLSRLAGLLAELNAQQLGADAIHDEAFGTPLTICSHVRFWR